MRRFVKYLQCICLAAAVAASGIRAGGNEPPSRLGSPFYYWDETFFTHIIGETYLLDGYIRAVSDIRHCGDIFRGDIRLYQPDLVTSGREIALSPLAMGETAARGLWRGRLWRMPGTLRCDLSLLHPAQIGLARSTFWGGSEGLIAPGAVLNFAPIDFNYDEPVTALAHREGFYGFQPVEFVHARRVTQRDYCLGGGYFPSSQGKFPHSRHIGRILWTKWTHKFDAANSADLYYQDGLQRVQLPTLPVERLVKRRDMDIHFQSTSSNSHRWAAQIYRAETVLKERPQREYGCEAGFGGRFSSAAFSSSIRLSKLRGTLTGGADYRLDEFEGGAQYREDLGRLNITVLLGASGWLPKRVKPTAAVEIGGAFAQDSRLALHFTQAIDAHSPQTMFARYNTGRLNDPFNVVWLANPWLPVIGQVLPVTIYRSGHLGFERPLRAGDFKAGIFGWRAYKPAIWRVQGDTLLTAASLNRREGYGWLAQWALKSGCWRGNIGLIRQINQDRPGQVYPTLLPEPGFRMQWEAGWHRIFWNEVFETDVSLSGRYYSRFRHPLALPSEQLGGAYPVDLRFTGRIKRFTFQYGVNNINSYPFWLVPWHKMMHKEEYWEIQWTMLN